MYGGDRFSQEQHQQQQQYQHRQQDPGVQSPVRAPGEAMNEPCPLPGTRQGEEAQGKTILQDDVTRVPTGWAVKVSLRCRRGYRTCRVSSGVGSVLRCRPSEQREEPWNTVSGLYCCCCGLWERGQWVGSLSRPEDARWWSRVGFGARRGGLHEGEGGWWALRGMV